MGNTARKPTNGLHLLGLAKLLFGVLAAGHVVRHNQQDSGALVRPYLAQNFQTNATRATLTFGTHCDVGRTCDIEQSTQVVMSIPFSQKIPIRLGITQGYLIGEGHSRQKSGARSRYFLPKKQRPPVVRTR